MYAKLVDNWVNSDKVSVDSKETDIRLIVVALDVQIVRNGNNLGFLLQLEVQLL